MSTISKILDQFFFTQRDVLSDFIEVEIFWIREFGW